MPSTDGADRGDPVENRTIEVQHGPLLHVGPLRHGDVRTVMSMFQRLSERSRRARFNGPKPCLRTSELRTLSSVNHDRRVLVAYVEGDADPVAIARLVRDGSSAEVAFAVADEYQQRGIGTVLATELVADARAAGVKEITAFVSSDNPAAVRLLRRVANVLDICREGSDLWIRAAIA